MHAIMFNLQYLPFLFYFCSPIAQIKAHKNPQTSHTCLKRFLALTEGHQLRFFQNKILRPVLVPNYKNESRMVTITQTEASKNILRTYSDINKD